jgi:hypothetical protein
MGTITTTDGTEIFYKDWGSGQPIVFSHGWPLSADDWDTQMLFFLQHPQADAGRLPVVDRDDQHLRALRDQVVAHLGQPLIDVRSPETVSRIRAMTTLLTWARNGTSASESSTGTITAAASQVPCRSQGFITT